MRMIPSDRVPTSPGEMLLEEFIKPPGLTQGALADKPGMSRVAVNEIFNGRRGVTPATALRPGKAHGITPESWLNRQISVDLYKAEHHEEQHRAIDQVTPICELPSSGSTTAAGSPDGGP